MHKRFFFLVFLVVAIVSLIPVVSSDPDTESLYVNSKTTDLENWDERNPPSPYLADEDTGYIHEVKTGGATEGYFGFVDLSQSDVSINSATLYLECYGEDTNDYLDIWIDCGDGAGWVEEGSVTVDQLSYGWETLSLTSRLDSPTDVNNCQMYLEYNGVAGGDDIYVRRGYLYIDWSEAGQQYFVTVTQSLTHTWAVLTQTDFNVAPSQSITGTWDVLTQWDAVVDATQSIWSSWDVLTQWDAVTSLTQALTHTWTVATQQGLVVDVTQSMSFTWDVLTGWTAHTGLTQALSTTWTVITQSAFHVFTDVSNSFSWNVIASFKYTVGLTVDVVSSWIVDVTTGVSDPSNPDPTGGKGNPFVEPRYPHTVIFGAPIHFLYLLTPALILVPLGLYFLMREESIELNYDGIGLLVGGVILVALAQVVFSYALPVVIIAVLVSIGVRLMFTGWIKEDNPYKIDGILLIIVAVVILCIIVVREIVW